MNRTLHPRVSGAAARSRPKPVRFGKYDLLGSLGALVYSLPAWAYPFGNDQALHWYLGAHWLRGELPYVSGISSKPIGIFAVHALSIALLGPGQWAIRVSEALSVIAIGWLAALAARPAAASARDGELGLGALAFAGLYYSFFDYWDTAHPELWEAGCLLGALVLASRARDPWLRDAGAGALCAAGFMFKFPAAFPSLIVAARCALAVLREHEVDWAPAWPFLRPRASAATPARAHARAIALALAGAGARFLCGVALVFALCVLPYVLAHQLRPMWEVLYEFVRVYTSQAVPPPFTPTWLVWYHGGILLLIAPAFGLFGMWRAYQRRDHAALEIGALLFASGLLWAASVVAQGRYFNYHFVALAPTCAALCLFGMSEAPWFSPWPRARAFAAIGAALVLLLAIGPRWCTAYRHSYGKHLVALVRYLRDDISRDKYLDPFVGYAPFDRYRTLEHLAKQVREQVRAGDTLCVRGFLTPMYPLTALSCTSRHIVQDIVDTGLPDWPEEYAADLDRHPPTFIVTFTDRKSDAKALRRRGYRRIASESGVVVFRLGARPAGGRRPR